MSAARSIVMGTTAMAGPFSHCKTAHSLRVISRPGAAPAWPSTAAWGTAAEGVPSGRGGLGKGYFSGGHKAALGLSWRSRFHNRRQATELHGIRSQFRSVEIQLSNRVFVGDCLSNSTRTCE